MWSRCSRLRWSRATWSRWTTFPFTRSLGSKKRSERWGASVLDLPSYSPDPNPIEQLFAKLKALLRKAAARTQDALWETIGTSLEAFTPAECQNYIINSGYEFV